MFFIRHRFLIIEWLLWLKGFCAALVEGTNGRKSYIDRKAILLVFTMYTYLFDIL